MSTKAEVIPALQELGVKVDPHQSAALLRNQLRELKEEIEEEEGKNEILSGVSSMTKDELRQRCKHFGLSMTGNETKDKLTTLLHRHWVSSDPLGSDKLHFGTHKLKTYRSVVVNFPSYTEWCITTYKDCLLYTSPSPRD